MANLVSPCIECTEDSVGGLTTIDFLELNADGVINQAIKNHAVVGKVISNKNAKYLSVFAILKKAWKYGEDFECIDLENNMFLFVFPTDEDKKMYHGHETMVHLDRLLVLNEWDENLTLEEIDFSVEKFWVQVPRLPIGLITPDNATKIGGLFSRFHGSNINDESAINWDGHLSINVDVRVEEPLKLGFSLKRQDTPIVEIQFQYEKIPKFCFDCGRLGHSKTNCWFDCSLYTRAGKYGPWLRANTKWK